MLTRKDFLSLNFVKKEDYPGSYQGMRYMLHLSTTEEGEKRLEVTLWPEPYCFEATPEEEKISQLFSFDEEGMQQAIDWMNERYQFVKKTE